MNREVIGNNANGGAGSDVLTEFCYIDRTHPDTAIARRASQKALLRSSVNIDAPLEGIAIALFGTLQPENAGHDRITPRDVRPENLARRGTRLKNLSERLPHPDLCFHGEFSQRSCITAHPIPDAISGS